MPGSQVAQRIGGGNTGTSQHTMGTQRSLFLFPFTTFPSALSNFPLSYFPKREVSFHPKYENVGNWCWAGICVHSFHPELSSCLSLCCCKFIARTSFVHFLKSPLHLFIFNCQPVGAEWWGRKSLEILPSGYLYWNSRLTSCLWNFRCVVLLMDHGIDWILQGTAGFSFGHKICLYTRVGKVFLNSSSCLASPHKLTDSYFSQLFPFIAQLETLAIMWV